MTEEATFAAATAAATNKRYDMIRTITHAASGAYIQIHPYGATLLSYCTPDGTSSSSVEHLFVSKQAVLDATQPVRGGIPLVFPIFGPPSSKESTMPQHGFARRNIWTFVSEEDSAESASVTYQLSLESVQNGRGEGNMWSLEGQEGTAESAVDCRLELAVSFNATHLTTRLRVFNTSATVSFPFQALLHTYYKVEGGASMQPDQCYVTGLEGYILDDKVTGASGAITGPEPITIAGEVDRVYTPPSSSSNNGAVNVTIGVGSNRKMTLQASAQVGSTGTNLPVSCVVWNPHIAKAAGMGDFGNEEYHDMLCVEPGILDSNIQLAPGETAWLEQTLRVE